MTATMAGAQNAARQPWLVTRYPAQTTMTAPPIWWEAFQMPHALPISRGLYQYVRSRVHGGTPTP